MRTTRFSAPGTSSTDIPENAITERIIKCAIEVHKQLGPGLLESIYEDAMCIECQLEGLSVISQVEIPVNYKGKLIGKHRLDLLVGSEIVVELKAIKALEDIHFAQVVSYLKATGRRVGLLLNFKAPTLVIKRIVA